MAFILPKGVVKNSPDIEGSIESIATQPLDVEDIAQFWKVYTTTKRRLLDPTAERLENYWWRIWGSRRRELNGATVARLFALISDGQSFVPLRGPANRDEGTPPLNRTTRHGPGAASATTIHDPSQIRPYTTSSPPVSKPSAPMPHPILKKTRGPSSTGPRPTARFISPHESDAETATTNNSSNRSSSPHSRVVVQPPSPDSRNTKSDKKATIAEGGKKKGRIVASTAAKKRPVMNRRQSSQSSTDGAAKVEAQVANQLSTERTAPISSDITPGKGKAPSKLQENFSPDHLAAPSPRKRPSSKLIEAKGVSSRKPDRKNGGIERSPETVAQGEPGPSAFRSIENQQTLEEEISEGELDLQQTLLDAANAGANKTSTTSSQQISNESDGSHPTLATTSIGTHDTSMSGTRLKSAASLAPTLADATGQLNLSDSATPQPRVTGAEGRDKGKDRDPGDLFAKRPVPSASGNQAAPTPDGPLAKSKSQLTFLLQKDRARTDEHKPTDREKKKDRQN